MTTLKIAFSLIRSRHRYVYYILQAKVHWYHNYKLIIRKEKSILREIYDFLIRQKHLNCCICGLPWQPQVWEYDWKCNYNIAEAFYYWNLAWVNTLPQYANEVLQGVNLHYQCLQCNNWVRKQVFVFYWLIEILTSILCHRGLTDDQV